MIIDAHSHISAPADLAAYKAGLMASRGSHGRGGVKISDEAMMAALRGKEGEGPSPKARMRALPYT